MKRFITTSLLMFFVIVSIAQNITVKGIVVSDQDSEPLIGANVIVVGKSVGTITDFNGNFILENVPSNGSIEVSYVGYQTLVIPVDNRSNIEVRLKAGNLLSEIVVTSFSIAKDKKVLGYASQKVSAEDLMQSRQPNVVNALQGKLAGVSINSSSGAPGAGANIVIRGINSLSGDRDNQPIIVIDGIIVSNATIAGNVLPSAGSNAINNNEQFMNTNRLADLNTDDIESINVLRGAAATALYGQRASNGALIITTKKGKAGKSSINYSFSYGLQNVAKAPAIQTTYYQGFNGLVRRPPATVFWQYGPPALATDVFYNPHEVFYRTGNLVSHSLSMSGGTERTNFQTSLSYLNNDGIIPNSNFNRITARLSAGHQLTDKFRVGAQINFANTKNISPASGDKSIFSSLSFWSPSFDVNDYLNEDGSQKNPFDGIIDNPRFLAETSPLKTNVHRVFGDVNFEYKFNSWLQARYQLTADYFNDNRNRVVRPELDLGSQVGGFVVDQSIDFKEINSNLLITAERKISDDLGLAVTMGHVVTDIQGSSTGSRGENFVAPGFFNILNTTNQFVIKTNSLQRLVGVFGEARLDYKDYLYLNITGRNDWSSTLPKQNRSFFYPSVSLSYILTNSIIEENDAINFAKLRGSIAEVGKDAPPYRIGNYFSITPGFPFGDVGGFRRDINTGNFNLLPEITNETEIGVEARLFNFLSLEANYFIQKSKNQIINVPVSNVTGYASYTTNAGVIKNQGVELLLGITPLKGAFRWDIDVNWSRIRSRVESMPEQLKEITYLSANGGRVVLRIEEGGSVGDLYGFDWKRNENGQILIGSNGLPSTNQSEYIKVGNALPDWQGGINNTLSYKGISLNFLLEFRNGGDVVDLGEMNGIRNGIVKFTEDRNKRVIWNGVTADGSPNTTPVVLDQNTYRSYAINSHYSYSIQDGSWFRIRNLNLSYNIPKSLIGSKVKFLRVGISANNLFLSTPFRGYDPEGLAFGSGTNLIGFTGRNAPNTRNWNFNVNVGF